MPLPRPGRDHAAKEFIREVRAVPGVEFVRPALHGDFYRLPNGSLIMVPMTMAGGGRALTNYRKVLSRRLTTVVEVFR